MEKTAQDLIKRIKEIKRTHNISYHRIIKQMEENHEENPELPVISLTTLRRVFSNGSESRASSYNFEETLLPIAEAVDKIAPAVNDEPAYAKEIEALKAVISVQNEELDRIMELKDHLEDRITFLLEQIEIKDRRLDEKDELIKKLMEKCL